MTPRNAELREIATATKELSDTERLVFEVQYGRCRRDPGIATLLALFMADRFWYGQVGLGILKLATLGGLGIWALVDLITARGMAAEHNAAAIRDITAHLTEARP